MIGAPEKPGEKLSQDIISGALGEELSRETMDTPAFLKLIGSKEAPMGYNQLFGEAKPSTTLTGMTLDEVMALQTKRAEAGVKSTAAGRYQFLHRTLSDLKGKLKLAGTEKFDEALQDRLAIALMERRGLSKFQAGKISSKEFANSLAKEWASLPVVDGKNEGKSYYEGDGLNKALIKPEDVLKALESNP